MRPFSLALSLATACAAVLVTAPVRASTFSQDLWVYELTYGAPVILDGNILYNFITGPDTPVYPTCERTVEDNGDVDFLCDRAPPGLGPLYETVDAPWRAQFAAEQAIGFLVFDEDSFATVGLDPRGGPNFFFETFEADVTTGIGTLSQGSFDAGAQNVSFSPDSVTGLYAYGTLNVTGSFDYTFDGFRYRGAWITRGDGTVNHAITGRLISRPEPQPTPVPVPATLPLLAGALLLGGVWGRRVAG
jgi:hypothetical protein